MDAVSDFVCWINNNGQEDNNFKNDFSFPACVDGGKKNFFLGPAAISGLNTQSGTTMVTERSKRYAKTHETQEESLRKANKQ